MFIVVLCSYLHILLFCHLYYWSKSEVYSLCRTFFSSSSYCTLNTVYEVSYMSSLILDNCTFSIKRYSTKLAFLRPWVEFGKPFKEFISSKRRRMLASNDCGNGTVPKICDSLVCQKYSNVSRICALECHSPLAQPDGEEVIFSTTPQRPTAGCTVV